MIESPGFLIKEKKINSIVAFYCNQIYINVKFKGCAESADCNL